MEFRFNVNEVFSQPIAEIGSSLIPSGFKGDRRAMWDALSKVTDIINAMGSASAAAQGLTKPITTADRLRNSNEQKVYLMVDPAAFNGKGAVTGMLKTGTKGLYVFDRDGQNHHIKSPCVLDFYVHESKQRAGLGKLLFEYMLQRETVRPEKMAVDRPSEKLLGFLHKHYGLNSPIRQMNNFVVYDGFFPLSAEEGVTNDGNISKRSANGLQSQVTSPFGRYGAPRPLCSMGQIIHNQSTAVTPQEPSGQQGQQQMNTQQMPPQVTSESTKNPVEFETNFRNSEYQRSFDKPTQIYAPNQVGSISKLNAGADLNLLNPGNYGDRKPVAEKLYVDDNGRPMDNTNQYDPNFQQNNYGQMHGSQYNCYYPPQEQFYGHPNQQNHTLQHGPPVQHTYPPQTYNPNISHLMQGNYQSPSTTQFVAQTAPSQNTTYPQMYSQPNQIVQPTGNAMDQPAKHPSQTNMMHQITPQMPHAINQPPVEQNFHNQSSMHIPHNIAMQQINTQPIQQYEYAPNNSQSINQQYYQQAVYNQPPQNVQHSLQMEQPGFNQNYAHGDARPAEVAQNQIISQQNNDPSSVYKTNQIMQSQETQKQNQLGQIAQNGEPMNMQQLNRSAIQNVQQNSPPANEQMVPHFTNVDNQYRKYQLEHFAARPLQPIPETSVTDIKTNHQAPDQIQPQTEKNKFETEGEKYLKMAAYKEPLIPTVPLTSQLPYRAINSAKKTRMGQKSEIFNKSRESSRGNYDKRPQQYVNPLLRNITSAQRNQRATSAVTTHRPIIEQRQRGKYSAIKTDLPNSKGSPRSPHNVDPEPSQPKLDRPQTLPLQTTDEIAESEVPNEITEDVIDAVDEEIKKITIHENEGLKIVNDHDENIRKTPSHLTDQGYFDLKFYHNKLW